MKSPTTGAGVMRRRGRGPLHGFSLGIHDNRIPTGDEDAARKVVPLAFKTGDGDSDLARSDDLHGMVLTFGGTDLGHYLDSDVGNPIFSQKSASTSSWVNSGERPIG
jgi:hypothetical protein